MKNKLMDGVYKGLFWGIGDPYSAYLTKDEYNEIMISTTGEYQGIGVTIAPDDNNLINVVSPIDGSPAEAAESRPATKSSASEENPLTAVQSIRRLQPCGVNPAQRFDLIILRGDNEMEFDITRANIVMKSVRSEVLDGNIGYIRISSFEEKTAEDFKQQLRDMELKRVKGLIIDLRDNGGGLVESSVQIADMLLGEGVVTYTEDRNGAKEYYKSNAGKTDLPYVILVNGEQQALQRSLPPLFRITKEERS